MINQLCKPSSFQG